MGLHFVISIFLKDALALVAAPGKRQTRFGKLTTQGSRHLPSGVTAIVGRLCQAASPISEASNNVDGA